MRKWKTQESLLTGALGAHKGHVCTCEHECACTCTHTHTHTHPAHHSGPGWRAQRGHLVSYVNNLCLQTFKAQLKPCFSLQGGRERKGPSEPPKCTCQEQGYTLSPKPSPTHTPFLFPQVGSSLGVSPLDQGTHSQTAKYLT